jgi:hypothetical protein
MNRSLLAHRGYGIVAQSARQESPLEITEFSELRQLGQRRMRSADGEVNQAKALVLCEALPQRNDRHFVGLRRVVHGVGMRQGLFPELPPPCIGELLGERAGRVFAVPVLLVGVDNLQMPKFVKQDIVQQVTTKGPGRPLPARRCAEFGSSLSPADIPPHTHTIRENGVQVDITTAAGPD